MTASRTLPSVIVAVDVAQIESSRRRETFMATREDDSKGFLWECPHSNDVWCLATAGDAVIVGGPESEMAPQPEKAPSGGYWKSELMDGKTTEKKVEFAIEGDAWSPENLRALGWTRSWRDPFCSPGYLRILDGSNGQERAALRLPATPLQDGIAVADGRIYLTAADGSLICVGR